MAESGDVICDICDGRHVRKFADHPECEEGLCTKCLEHHNISKVTRHHEVISVENYKILPKFILELDHYCNEHHMKYQMFCPDHNKLSCSMCVTTYHKKCENLTTIPELIKAFKSSALIENIERSLRDIDKNLKTIIEDREQNLKQIREQCHGFRQEIREARDKINTLLDSLEKRAIDELHTAEENVKQQIENLIKKLTQVSMTVVEKQNQISAIKQYASDIQTFLGIKAIGKEVEKEERFITTLYEDENLQHVNLKFKINDKISEILSSVTQFGFISSETSPPSVVLKLETDKQAQIMSVIQQPCPKSIGEIHLTLQSTVTFPTGKFTIQITDCIICPQIRTIFIADSNRLIILNDDGTLSKEIHTSSSPSCVTCIDERTIAVSTSVGIHIINIESGRIERKIKTSSSCYGIIYEQGKLLWCQYSQGINMAQLPDETVTTVVKQGSLPDYCYITPSGDKIYQTNHWNKTVTCYSMKGEKMWEYKDISVLGDPVGVTIDNDMNVYVTSDNDNKLIVISPDGKQCRMLLDAKNEIHKPRAVYFDKIKNNLLIVNLYGPAFLYKLS